MSTIYKTLVGAIVVMMIYTGVTAPSAEEKAAAQAQETAAKVAKEQAEKDRFNKLPLAMQQAERITQMVQDRQYGYDRAIKKNLRDPDSYQRENIYLNTKHSSKTKATVTVVYRARNGFGGMNRETADFEYKWNDTTKQYEQ